VLNRRVDFLVEANVSEKRSVSIFRAEVNFLSTFRAEVNFTPEDGDSTLLRNVGFYQPIRAAT
jgi:hypothetical protein